MFQILNERDKQVLADLKVIFEDLKIPMLLVGAGARILMFDRRYGIPGRTTEDWDVAVQLENWSTYQALRDFLTQGKAARFRSTQTSNRFIHFETGIAVDIVPFGNISDSNLQIQWPDSGNQMNVAGFAEALLNPTVETIDDLELSVVSIPAFIVLKLFAWGDRGEKTGKDLSDIDLILKNYTDDERVYSELLDEIANGDIEYRNASIHLLGQDIRKIFQEKTIAQINSILNKLVSNWENEDVLDDSLEHRLKIFQQGINRLDV